MIRRSLVLACLTCTAVYAQSGTTASVVTVSGAPTSVLIGDDILPTGSGVEYLSYSSTIDVSSTPISPGLAASNSTALSNATASSVGSGSSTITTSNSLTILVGGGQASTITGNGTRSSSTSSDRPTNTQPCNNYPEFCSRRYSNITEVCAHNSPFHTKNNAASNQQYDAIQQLNDGIRMLQGQAHYENETFFFCHTSCNLLNGGLVSEYLNDVAKWVSSNPYDVVTILIGNSDFKRVSLWAPIIQQTDLYKYLYVPPKIPMDLTDWPTLSELILSQKRVVLFMDYQANQTEVPFILDEFSQMWETPFSPTNRDFPCTEQRPPKLGDKGKRSRMYMANHNLNTEISIAGSSFLVPNTVDMAVTNNISGYGSLGVMADNCTAMWDRPPNFLLVDYYNVGNGSVFEVAAQHNNVTYDGPCCGMPPSSAGAILKDLRVEAWTVAVVMGLILVLY